MGLFVSISRGGNISHESILIQKFPRSKVTGLSNSHSQKVYIDTQAESKGLKNLVVLTGDVNEYEFTSSRFLFPFEI